MLMEDLYRGKISPYSTIIRKTVKPVIGWIRHRKPYSQPYPKRSGALSMLRKMPIWNW
ncbi:MAG: hypothetical protein IKH57_08790 [Clostridia bacterium]|nr:hypothetical protein [Clostridia bacterium]